MNVSRLSEKKKKFLSYCKQQNAREFYPGIRNSK